MRLAARIASAGLCALMAAGSAAQALSNIDVRAEPVRAISLSPLASTAMERLATMALKADKSGMVSAPPLSLELARRAHAANPLATEAMSILSLGLADPARRAGAIKATQGLSRRGRVMGIVALQDAVQRKDADDGIAALDRLLRVYPGYSKQMIAPLVGYIGQEEALPALLQALRYEPEWRNAFFAATPPPPYGLRNLSRIRIALGPDYPLDGATQTRLVARLIAADLWDEALAIREMDTSVGETWLGGRILWSSGNTPFEWQFMDERAIFARPTLEMASLRVRIDPGQGGVLATRLVMLPEGARTLRYSHSLSPTEALGNFTLEARCARRDEAVASVVLTSRKGELDLSDAACRWVYLSLNGRVWTTDPRVEGEVAAIVPSR